jgi:hypothetical protein
VERLPASVDIAILEPSGNPELPTELTPLIVLAICEA